MKLVLKALLYLVLGYSILVILEYARQGFLNDVSFAES